MNQQHEQDRRKRQELSYDAIVDRREREPQTVPAPAGSIRPGANDVLPRVERRRFPEAGSE